MIPGREKYHVIHDALNQKNVESKKKFLMINSPLVYFPFFLPFVNDQFVLLIITSALIVIIVKTISNILTG